MILFQQLRATPILVDHETGCIRKLISLSFHAHEECPNGGRTCPVHQFESKVVLDPEIDSKSDSTILIWIGSPPWRVHLLGSPAPS
jgi:hypothetical protein